MRAPPNSRPGVGTGRASYLEMCLYWAGGHSDRGLGNFERSAMKAWFSFCLIAIAVLTACQHEPTPSAPLSRRDVEKLMAQIHPAMTLAQIAVVVPHPRPRPFAAEHGGVWYDMAVSDGYIIQIRLPHPQPGSTLEHSVINFSPRLRDRKTLQLISGPEKVW